MSAHLPNSIEIGRLQTARTLLVARLDVLEARIRGGDETGWTDYLATVNTLVRVRAETVPGAHGELLTSAQLADRLNLSEKTVRRRWKKGQLGPSFGEGKTLRWRADARPTGTANGTASRNAASSAAGYGPGRAVRGRA
jgi:hypothetical protein